MKIVSGQLLCLKNPHRSVLTSIDKICDIKITIWITMPLVRHYCKNSPHFLLALDIMYGSFNILIFKPRVVIHYLGYRRYINRLIAKLGIFDQFALRSRAAYVKGSRSTRLAWLRGIVQQSSTFWCINSSSLGCRVYTDHKPMCRKYVCLFRSASSAQEHHLLRSTPVHTYNPSCR